MKCTPKDDELERYFYTVDEQGSTILITNNCANIANEYYYDAFGNVIESREDVHNRITYTGQLFDGATQQYYLRARFYNPAIGRFTQEDIYRGDGLNLYAYCRNNPVMYYDPSGYVCEEKYNQYKEIRRQHPDWSAKKAKRWLDAKEKLSKSANGDIGATIDRNTGSKVGRFIADNKGNVLIEPEGGRTVSAGRGGIDTHTLYPNGSNYQRFNPKGHPPKSTKPHAHGHLEGTGSGMRGQGPSIDVNGNVVPWNSSEAHWDIH